MKPIKNFIYTVDLYTSNTSGPHILIFPLAFEGGILKWRVHIFIKMERQ